MPEGGPILFKSGGGFSLIELLIVVAIILILAAIAIPNLLRSRMAANQASAVGSLRLISTSEVTYSSTFNTGFSSDLATLGPPSSGNPTASAAGLIDSVLATGVKSGYRFTYSSVTLGGRVTAYMVNANPLVLGSSGLVYYFTDESAVIKQNSSGAASASDSPIAG